MQERPAKLYQSLQIPLIFVGTLWLIHALQWILGMDWGYWGVFPRAAYGIKGILLAPLIHGDMSHLLSNSVPLLVLWTLIRYFYPRVANRSFAMIYILTGLAVWILARSVFHIGASGVVYGLVAFLLGNGIFRRNFKSIVISLMILFFYSGMFVGVLPNQEGISWESHLYGGFVGLFVAYFYKEEIEADEEESLPSWADEEELPEAERPFYFDRDLFDKTHQQRQQETEERGGWNSTNTWDI